MEEQIVALTAWATEHPLAALAGAVAVAAIVGLALRRLLSPRLF